MWRVAVIEYAIGVLLRWKDCLSQNDSNANLHFTPLSPTDSAEDAQDYLDAIKWGLDNKKIKNIAITGPYGAGKSSIIQTFQKKFEHSEEYQFLNISLATFKDTKASEVVEKDNEEVLRLIELSILQQIFYHEADSSIPDSRFTKIEKRNRKKLIFVSFACVVTVLSYLFLFSPEKFNKLSIFAFDQESQNLLKFISSSLCLLALFFLSYKLMFFVKGLVIRKVSFTDAEIEIDEGISKSILNKYLDEILYFFEVTKNNIVVIEDLDRFEQTDVFTKLRELNLLLNSSKKISRKIVFLYAIKDEMFLDKDRAKFFDFIVPVIPVINSSNSSEKLREIVKRNSYSISQTLIDDVSLFIDDMRLLYNVMNEYYIYSKKINSSLDQDKLLAIIFYKNMYPYDFSLLSRKEGVLYSVLSSRSMFVNDESIGIDKEILEEKKQLRKIEEMKITDVTELRSLYINKLLEKILLNGQGFYSFLINNSVVSIDYFLKDNNFDYLRDHLKGLTYFYNTSHHRNSVSQSFSDLEKEVSKEETYQERFKLLTELADSTISSRKSKIRLLEKKKDELRKLKISDLLRMSKVTVEIKHGTDARQKEMLNMLIRQDYIGEDYFDYLSIFYEGSLSRADFEFLISVKIQKELAFDYKIEKVENLVKKIGPYDFEKRFILNYSLLDFLLTRSDYIKEKERFIGFLANESEDSISFIDGFIEASANKHIFINLLCKQWSRIWEYINSESKFLDDKKTSYFRMIIEYADVKDIKSIFDGNENIFYQKESFLVDLQNTPKVIAIIKTLDLRLRKIHEDVPLEVLEYIYLNNSYEINPENLRLILRIKKAPGFEAFETENYKCIHESKLGNMIDYVESNLSEYIKMAYLKLDFNIEETETYILKIVNSPDVDYATKKEFLDKVVSKISSIEQVELDENVDLLLECSMLRATWKNMVDVFIRNKNEISEELVSFLSDSENAAEVSEEKIDKNYPDEKVALLFIKAILLENSIPIDSYKLFVPKVPYVFPALRVEELDQENVEVLIENRTLQVTSDNFSLLKEHFYDLRIKLLSRNKGEFVEALIEDIGIDDATELINLKSISVAVKEMLINKKGLEFVSGSEELLDSLAKLLLAEEMTNFEVEILKCVIIKNRLPVDSKLKVFLKYQNNFSIADCEVYLKSLPEPYSVIAEKGKAPKIENTPTNLRFVEALDEKKVISSFKETLIGNKIQIATFKS